MCMYPVDGKAWQRLGRKIRCLYVSEGGAKEPVTKPDKCLPQSTLMLAPIHSPCLLPGQERPAPPGGFHDPVGLGGLSPHTFPSVGEGRQDEEAVFFLADPAHQLMNGTDS